MLEPRAKRHREWPTVPGVRRRELLEDGPAPTRATLLPFFWVGIAGRRSVMVSL